MKKRVAGGVVLVAIGIGIWLSNLFTGIGPGGAGTNVGMNPEAVVSLADPSTESGGSVAELNGDESMVGMLASQPVVIIDEQEYLLQQEDQKPIPTTIKEIVELALDAEPDSDGIRVQIKRRGSSRPSAETALDKALADAGITEEQIQRHAGFVE